MKLFIFLLCGPLDVLYLHTHYLRVLQPQKCFSFLQPMGILLSEILVWSLMILVTVTIWGRQKLIRSLSFFHKLEAKI